MQYNVYLNSEKKIIESVCKTLGFETVAEFTTGDPISHYTVTINGVPKKHEQDLQIVLNYCFKISNNF